MSDPRLWEGKRFVPPDVARQRAGVIDDGFGNTWVLCDRAGGCGLQIVRPGKVQCWCDNESDGGRS